MSSLELRTGLEPTYKYAEVFFTQNKHDIPINSAIHTATILPIPDGMVFPVLPTLSSF